MPSSNSVHPAWLPRQVNTGPWLSHYTVDELERRVGGQRAVLPICSLDTPNDELEQLGPLVLPPLFQESLDDDLKTALLARIEHCFPYYHGSRRRSKVSTAIEVVEFAAPASRAPATRPRILAFSVDPAVEEHGPHLPLATDRIQSYAVLARLAEEHPEVTLAPPLDYGHLTWGLPRGLSIDIPPAVLTRYVAKYAVALAQRHQPEAMYVVDVHGSPVHRRAIQDGLTATGICRFSFRWLHEPLVEFASERGDQHAGAVETAVIEAIAPGLLDARWWPERLDDLAANEMSFELALQLQADLPKFIEYAESRPWNGIVGRIENYPSLDGAMLLERMTNIARQDVQVLLRNQRKPDAGS